jgi:MFS family permease
MKKGINSTILKVTVLSLSLLQMSATAVSPILAVMAKTFPSVAKESIQMLFVLPLLVMLPFALGSGGIASHVSKKLLTVLGLILFSVGGLAPVFLDSFPLIVASRVVLGIGLGILFPFMAGFVADFFHGPNFNSMMGLQSATGSAGGILAAVIPGFLCAINWHYAFLYHGIGILILLVVLFKLPEPERFRQEKGETMARKQSLPRVVYVLSLATALSAVFVNSFFTNVALVIDKDHLGSAGSSGIIIALFTVGSLVTNISFGKISKLFQQFCAPLGLAFTGFGLLLANYAYTLPLFTFGTVIAGLGFGTFVPSVMADIGRRAPQSLNALAFAVCFVCANLGGFLSPIVLMSVGRLFGASGVGRFAFLFSGACLIIGAIAWAAIATMIGKPREDATGTATAD